MRLNSSITLTLDVADWMRRTGRFNAIRATDGREWIQACCVFHDDTHASFAVNSDTGAYKCQACGASGTFISLVRHVEGHDTAYDAQQSLIARFGRFVVDVNEPLALDFGDKREEAMTFVDFERIVRAMEYKDEYLCDKRSLTTGITEMYDVGVDFDKKAVVIPWFDADGRCVTIKHRSIEDKRFWYDPPVSPGRLKRLLYGFHLARTAPIIVVCEGEIDAMSVAQAGFAAVALGSTNVSDAQLALLRNSAADEIVVFVDNPAVDTLVRVKRNGRWTTEPASAKARKALIDGLVGHKRVSEVDWSLVTYNGVKDANDVLRNNHEEGVRALIEYRIPVGLPLSLD